MWVGQINKAVGHVSVLNIPPKSLDGYMLVEGGIFLWRSGKLGYYLNVTSCQSSMTCLNSWNDAMMAQAFSSAVPSRAMIEQDKQIDSNAQSLSNIPMTTLTRDFYCQDVSSVWSCFHNCAWSSCRVTRVLDVLASTVRMLQIWLRHGNLQTMLRLGWITRATARIFVWIHVGGVQLASISMIILSTCSIHWLVPPRWPKWCNRMTNDLKREKTMSYIG